MKGLKKKFRRGLAGFLSFVLTMTSFNMVSWADVASAFEKENATFVMSGEDLRDSAQAAIDNGDEFNFEDLGVDTSDRSLAKEYQRLFETGSVFEFAPAYDMDEEEYADGAELRMFIRINGDPEGYQITGDEDIIFLYINDSSARVTFRSRIDGYTTQKVTVKGNSTLLEAAGPTVPSDGAGAAGGAGAGTNGAAGGEVQNPNENAGGENGTVEGNVQNPDSDAADGSLQNPDANAGEGNGTTDGTVENPDAGVNDGTDNGTTGSDIQNPAGNADEGNGTAGETTGNPEINGNNGSGTAGSDIQNPDANADSDKNANTGKDEQIQNPADHSGSSDNGQNSENGKTEEGQKSEAGADKQSSNDDKGGSNASSDEGNAGSGASDSGSSDSGSSDSGASSSGDAVVSAASVIRNYTHILTTSVNNEAGSDEKASFDEKNEEKEVVSADSGDSKEKADAGEKKDAEEVKADTEDSNSSDSDNKEAAAAPADDVESNTVDDGDKADAVIPADGEEQNSSDDQADGQGEITAPADNQDNAVIDDNVKDDADKNAAADSKADDTNVAGGKNDNTLAVEPEDEEEKEEVSKTGTTSGKTYGQIVLDESYYAKAYVTTLNKLHVDVSKEGYAVTYTVTPVGTAAVKGAKNVEAGKDLTFTVKPQVGYVIDSVTANGESLEAVEEDDATDSNAETGVKRFVVPEVEEEQEIVVTMAETGEHPEFNFSKTLGDVVVSLHAEEGILPAGTVAKVTEVTEKVEEAVKEKTAEETGEDTSANTVLAYDIKLFVENEAGELEALDNSWSENGYVEVTFAGKAIEEKSAEAESLEIVHVDTGSIDVTQRSIKVVAADQVQGVETVSEAVDISGDKSVSDISFDASHFSIYAIIAAKKVYKEVTINKGETITLHSELGFGTWKSSNSGVAKINGSNNGNSVSISGVSKGEATIKRGSQETFKVIVTDDTTAYFYIWRPDSSIDQEYTVTWEYSNTGTVINLPNPKNVAGNTKFDVSNIKLFPKSYPVITKAGKSYVYDEDGGEGTYTVNWSYIIRSDGYNIGTDAYKIGPCYHVDGYAVLVEETNCTVSFDVQEVGDENFRPVESYPIIIKKNTNIKDLNVPVVADKTVDGDQYKFDGWYKDKECTVKASFTEGRITENTTFYGRYVQVLKPGQLAYDANGGIGVMTPTKGSVNKNVTVASNTFTRAGYSFSGWNTEREGTGTYYAPGSQYKLLAGDNILYAQWTPDKNTKYSVAYYYQNSDNGKFVEDTKLRDDTRTGVTGTLVEIAEDDKVAEKAGYILDNSQIKNWQGTISGDGKLVLKVYFKLQYTIAIAGDDHVNITSDSPIYVDWGSNATGSWTIDEGYSISEVTVNRVPVKVASDATSYTMSNIKENIDVYVKTKSEDANYKIEYYQENLPGAEARYTKVKEGSGKGKTGERVQINAENFDGFEYQKDKDEYFVGKTPQSQSSPIIAGDGSLVIKLYYDRKTNLSVEVKYVEYVSDDADYSTAEELIKSEKLTGTFGTVYDIPEKSIQDYDLKLIIDRNNPKVFNENMDTIYVTYTKRAAYTVWFNGIQITDLINDQNQNNYQTSDDEWITKLSWNGMASNNTSVPYSENEIKDLADQMLKIYSDNTGWDNLSYKSFDIVQEIDLPNGKKDWETLYTSGGHESLKNVKLRAGYETRYQIYFDSTMSIKATGANRIYNGELQNLIESLTTQIDGSGAEITPTYTYEIAKITNNVIGNYKASKNPTEIEAGEYSIRIKAKKDKFKDTETVIRAVISKRPITVYAGSLTEKYDGSEKEVTKFTYTVSNEDNTAGALEDHTVSAVLENNKRTEAGDQVVRVVENSVRILSGETNVTGNYVVSLETGLLIISRRDDLKITVDAESLSHVYDGAGHGIKAAEASDTKGTTIEYSTNGRTWSGTIPQFTDYKEGGYPVYVRAKNLNYSNTAEAEVVFNITKRPVTVSAGTETFTYDGSEKKVTEIKAEPVNETNTEGILPDHTAKAELENNKRTDAGEQIVKIKEGSVTILSGRKDVTENYAVSLGDGKLIINQKGGLRVTVDAENLSHVYDGAGHGIKAAEASDAKGTTIEYSTDGESWSGTIPQFTEYREEGYLVHVRAKNDNYSNVAEADVVFRITKRPIKVAAGILETEYDGSEKAVTEFTYTVSNKENTAGALKDHKVSAVLKNNTRTEAGEQTVSVEENSVRILSGEADVTKNYAVSLEDGKLTVKRKDGLKVTVDAESLSHVYDGAGHGIKAAEASDAKGTTIEYSTDGESWSGTIPQFTEYREEGYPVHVRAKNDNYSNVAEADVVFRITKRPIKVAAGILETEYDGSEKAVTEFTYTVSNKENTAGALKDHKVSAVLKNNTRTEAGEQTVSVEENSVRILSGEADVTKNYAVSLEDGKLTVKRKDGLKVTVDAESLSHVYDGAGHGIKAAEASDAKGTTIEYSTDGESWSGTIPQFTEYQEGGYPVYVRATNDNYSNAATAEAVFNITKRPVTVSAGIMTAEYDGSEKEVTEIRYTEADSENAEGVLAGHTVTAKLLNNKRTDAGEQAVSIEGGSVRILSGRTDVTKNYAVSLGDGKLTISQKGDLKVIVDAESLSHVYDGAGHGIKAAEASDAKGTTIEYSTNGRTWSGTIPQFTEYKEGGYPVYVRAKNLNYSNTAEAEVVFSITKRPVTVSAGTETFAYDGSEKKVTEIKAEPANGTNTEGILPDHTAKAELENNKRTDAGEQIVKIKEGSVTILSGGKNVTENYAVSLGDGKLIINKIGGLKVTVDAESLSHVYDGAGHGIKAAEASDAKGTTIEYSTDGESWSGTIPQFTEYREEGYPVHVRAKNDNYSNVAEADVVFRITKRPIKVAAGILETEYDGSEKAVTEFTYTVSNKENTAGALKDHKVSAVLKNNTRTEAGEQTVSVEENSVRILSGEADVTKNYAVSLEDGKLTVKRKDGLKVTVDAESLSHVYDGAGHGIKAAEASDAKGTTIEYSTDGESWSGTIPQFTEYQEGGYPVYVRATNDNYSNAATAEAVFNITKRPVTVSAGIMTAEYDGSEKEVTEIRYTEADSENAEGVLAGHTVTAKLLNNKRTDAGEQAVSIEGGSVRILSGRTDVTKNYAVSLGDGKLTISQKGDLKVTVDAESLSHVYDGAGHGIKAAEASDAKGTTIEYSTDGESWSGTIPQFTEYQEGGYPVYVRATNANYSNAATAEAVFNITKRPVTVSAGIMTADYDGSEKEVTEIRYTEADSENAEGVLAGHTVTAKLLNSKRTDAGEQTVSIEDGSVRILSGRTDVTKNYAVSLGDGKLIINQKGDLKVTVDAESLSHVYDGAGHGIKAAEASDAKGTTIEYSTDGESWSGTIPQFTEYQEGGYPVYVRAKNDNYSNVAEADVVFRITKRPIKVAAGILETEYDGSEKAVTEFTYTVSNEENTAGALKDHKVSAVLKNNTRTEAGEQTVSVEENSVRILSGEADVTKNYAVSLEDGKLTVNQKGGLKVTVDAESLSHVYDGAGHGIKAAEASDAKGTTIEYSTDGESWSGTIPQFTEYREEGYPVHVRAKNDNYSNVAEADVVFRITKRPIKVAAGILETEYDGSEKAVTEFTYTVSNKENTAGALKDHKVSAVLKNNTRTEAGEQTVSVEENSVRILSGEADVTKNYAVSLEDGKLTVKRKDGLKVTVDAESLSHVYDGAGHGIKAAEASDAKGTTIEYSTDGESWSGTIPQFTEYQEGGYPVYVRATNDNYSNAATAEVVFNITKRPVTVSAGIMTAEYDGSEKEVTEIRYTEADSENAEGVLAGHTVTAKLLNNKRTDAGEQAVSIEGGSVRILSGRTDVTKNYAVSLGDGKLTISQKGDLKVTVDAESLSHVYDGAGHGIKAAEASDAKGTTIEYSTDGESWSGTIPQFTEYQEGGYPVYVRATNANYSNAATAEAVFNITKRPVTVSAGIMTADYDGSEKEVTEIRYTEADSENAEGVLAGHTVTAKLLNSKRTDAGEQTVSIEDGSVRILSGRTDVTKNYAVSLGDGKLIINQKGDLKVTVDAESLSHVYDGAGHGIKAAEASDAKGTTIEYSTDGESWSGTIPQFTEYQEGGYPVYVRAKNDNYSNVAEADVVFRITKRPIKVAAGILETEYDGSEKAVTEFTYTVSNEENTAGALKDHKVSAVLKNNTRTEAGEQTVSVEENSVRILSGEADVTKNYAVSLEDGKLTVNQKGGLKVTVDAESLSHVYDGAGHGIKAAEASDAKGTTIEYSTDGESWSGTIPQFTEYREEGYPVHVRAKNDNYSNVAEADVVFRITKRPIKVAAGILETEYDGSEKAVTEFTYTVSNEENTAGALKDHKVSAVLKNNTRTEAGEQTVSVEENSVRILSGEADVTKNYAVSLEDGKLTVKRKDGLKVTVDAESLSHVYDGAGHGIKAAEASDAKGTTIEYSTDGESWSGTIPQFTEYQEGGYPVYVRATNPNYSNTAMADVIFMITQRPAHIQASNNGKVFGTADPELMASVTGIVTGEKLNYNLNRVAGEDVGTYPIEVILGSNPNYSITYDNAVFEITSADTNKVFITGTTATYDGKAYGVDASAVQNGSTILYSTNQTDWSETAPTFTEAGTYTVYVKATNPNYNETQVAEGTVVISKREITITADSAEKRYDGTDLTAPTATITGGTLAEGQTLESVTVTGAQRSTGTSANVASNAMIKSGNTDVTANYAITYIDGVLTVTSVGGNSGGNPGGNGGGSTPNENKPYQPGGPGDNNGPTVTIDPDAVPLANAPVDGSPTDNLILIDDGNVPLAGLPKTGDRAGAQAGLAAILSGFLLAAFSMLNNKKKEENK